VNAYKDEETIKTTLLEGSVRVKSEAGSQQSDETSVILKPGQQAVFSPAIPEASIHITSDIDIDQVMAWKNGWFEFENTDLKTIMRQISRWYDVDIEYQIKTGNERYGGRISRNLNLSSILKMLESYGVQFRLEGKKLVVQ